MLLINYISFATKIFNIFESLIENFSVRGECRTEKGAHQLRHRVLRQGVCTGRAFTLIGVMLPASAAQIQHIC